MILHVFRDGDIDFALTQTAREGWGNTAATFRVCLEHDADGCFIAEIDGAPVGMITSTCYAVSGWIGNLIVAPTHRGRGIGRQLMERAINRLESAGIRTIWLEADPMGVPLYRKLGFVDAFETPRMARKPDAAPTSPGTRGANELYITPLTPEGLNEVATFDAPHFGDDRRRLLGSFLTIANAGWVVRADQRIVGYAMALPMAGGVRLGPFVAQTADAAENLVDTFLSACSDKTIIAAVPGVNQRAVHLLESRGFRRGASCLRMVRGKPPEPAGDGLHALGDGAMG